MYILLTAQFGVSIPFSHKKRRHPGISEGILPNTSTWQGLGDSFWALSNKLNKLLSHSSF